MERIFFTRLNLQRLVMLNDAYIVHKQLFKYYIVPNVSNLPDKIPYIDSYLSFWFKYNAEVILKAMNAAFNEGCRFHTCFGDK